jgi:hypothetical protein
VGAGFGKNLREGGGIDFFAVRHEDSPSRHT